MFLIYIAYNFWPYALDSSIVCNLVKLLPERDRALCSHVCLLRFYSEIPQP